MEVELNQFLISSEGKENDVSPHSNVSVFLMLTFQNAMFFSNIFFRLDIAYLLFVDKTQLEKILLIEFKILRVSHELKIISTCNTHVILP